MARFAGLISQTGACRQLEYFFVNSRLRVITMSIRKVCIIGASGKLGLHLLAHSLERGYEVSVVCRPQSVVKLAAYQDRITIFPGSTNDRDLIRRAVADCDGVLIVLVPWGIAHYASGTARAVLDYAEPHARLIFSCGWHISLDGNDVYSWHLKLFVSVFGWIARRLRIVDIDDQVEACQQVFDSDRSWTVVRGSDLEDGSSEGMPVWSHHVGDPILKRNRTRRTDFALFMVAALTDDSLIQAAPAISGRNYA